MFRDELALENVGAAPAPPDESRVAPAAGVPTHADFLRTRYFGSLDGIRCFCILAVLFYHQPTQPEDLPRFFTRAYLGVDMFFVLSGFLIVTLLLRERDRTGTIDLRDFYIRRSLRIFPIYYLILFSLMVYYLVARPDSKSADFFFARLPYFLTYTSNWIGVGGGNLLVLWTLASEEQFYLAWPSIEKYGGRIGVAAGLVAVIAASQWANFGLSEEALRRYYGTAELPTIFRTTFTPIAMGVALAHLLHGGRGFAVAARLLGRKGSAAAMAVILVLIIQFTPPDLAGWPRLLIQATMTLLVGSVVIREDNSLRPLLSFGPIRRLGMVSYGFYLYHMWVLHFLRGVVGRLGGMNHAAFYALSVVCCWATAEASFRLIEEPLLRLRARFRR